MTSTSKVFNIAVDYIEPDMMSARANTRQVGKQAAEVATVCRYIDGERVPGHTYALTRFSRRRITRVAHLAQENMRGRDE